MDIKSIALAASTLVLSTSINAALVTIGSLSTYDDDSSNLITDSLNDVEYLRLDVLADLTYQQTLAVLDTQSGGGWSIADSEVLLAFTSALLSSPMACAHDGSSVTISECGSVTGWTDGMLGDNHSDDHDYVWFLDNEGEADFMSVRYTGVDGYMALSDYTLVNSDDLAEGHPNAISWLLVRDAAVVPIPAAVWLFGSGLIGLVGLARRKV